MATTQQAGSTELTLPTEHEAAFTRVLHAPAREVFAAWTEPDQVSKWMLGPDGWTMPVCEIDLRPGGTWRFVWRKEDGQEMEMSGEYRHVVPPDRLVHTERWGGDWPETLSTLELSEADGRTTLMNRILFPSRKARDAALATGMQEGIAISFDRLAALLAARG